MIGPGWLPTRPLRLKKRVLAYTRVRKRPARKPRPQAMRTHDDPTVVFQSGPVEFPIATLRSHDPRTQLRVMLVRFLASSWAWMRPRTVPFFVAALGLAAVIMSADYLHHVDVTPMHHHTAQR